MKMFGQRDSAPDRPKPKVRLIDPRQYALREFQWVKQLKVDLEADQQAALSREHQLRRQGDAAGAKAAHADAARIFGWLRKIAEDERNPAMTFKIVDPRTGRRP
jgi:hypothetical protein